MSHNTIGLLKANGQIEEYGNTSGGGSDTSFVGTTAEWNALTTEQKALYEIVNFTDDSTAPEVVDSVPTQNSTNLVQSGGVYNYIDDLMSNMADYVETSSIAAYPHAVGDLFIQLYNNRIVYLRTKAAIAVGDVIVIGTNCTWVNISQEMIRRDRPRELQVINYISTTENVWEACATFNVIGLRKYGFSTTWASGRPFALGIGNNLSKGYPNLCVFQEFDNAGHVSEIIWPYIPLSTGDVILYCKRYGGVGSSNFYRLWQL